MGGAELRLLRGDGNAKGGERLLDLVPSVAGDDHGALRRERADLAQQMQQHRPAGDRMEHLVEIGFHPRALAGGEDDGGEGRSAHGARFAMFRLPFP
jgi:hypothetical protein